MGRVGDDENEGTELCPIVTLVPHLFLEYSLSGFYLSLLELKSLSRHHILGGMERSDLSGTFFVPTCPLYPRAETWGGFRE